VTPLHQVGDLFRQALLSVPLPLVRLLFVGSLVALLIWVVKLPRSATTATAAPGSPDSTGNLKAGAVVALVIQIAIYSLL